MKFEVPDWLAERNAASWRSLLAVDDSYWRPADAPLLRLMQGLAAGDFALAFRVGASLGLGILISTAERYGLKPQDRFVVATNDNTGRIRLVYRAGDQVLEDQSCDEAEAYGCLVPLLDRLWIETRKQRYDEVKRVAMGDTGTRTIGTRVAGRVRFEDMVPGRTYSADDRVVLRHDNILHPHIAIVDENGAQLAVYYLPEEARLVVDNGQWVHANELLATWSRSSAYPV